MEQEIAVSVHVSSSRQIGASVLDNVHASLNLDFPVPALCVAYHR